MYPIVRPLGARFTGKRALITGGAGAMGKATALRLAAEGAHVALLDFRDDVVEIAEQIAAEFDVTATGCFCDVGDEASVVKAIVKTRERLGGIDVMVATAGVITDGATHETSLDDWERVIRVNLTGVFLTAKHTLPLMLSAGGGAIVNIASTGAIIATGRASSYDASKTGVLGFTRFVADEYADRNIRANSIVPGLVQSDLAGNSNRYARRSSNYQPVTPPQRYTRLQTVPQQRRASADEVAAAAAFLASDDASFVTGSTMVVDGGFTAT